MSQLYVCNRKSKECADCIHAFPHTKVSVFGLNGSKDAISCNEIELECPDVMELDTVCVPVVENYKE